MIPFLLTNHQKDHSTRQNNTYIQPVSADSFGSIDMQKRTRNSVGIRQISKSKSRIIIKAKANNRSVRLTGSVSSKLTRMLKP